MSSGDAFVYMLRCADGSLYTGWTNDIARRLAAHNAGTASRCTRARRPVALVYCERCADRSDALRREAAIKKLSKCEKEALLTSALNTEIKEQTAMGKIPALAEARELMQEYNGEEFHRRHAETVSGVMGYFAKEYDPENEEYWRAVGMLHDLDFERFPEQHCVKTVEIMREKGIDEGVIRACASHGWGLTEVEFEPELPMEKVLFAVDELTGLIGAVALMRPSKSVDDLEVKSVKKKFKQPSFAAGCSREVIQKGADMLGLELDELIEKTILAMRSL